MNRFIIASTIWITLGVVAVVSASNLAKNTAEDLDRLNQARAQQICELVGDCKS